MKNYILLTLILLSTAISSLAQSNDAVNYQSVIRDNNGAYYPNQPVSVRFTIYQGSPSGTLVYEEVHQDTTNDFGLVNLRIGEGLPTFSTFGSIDWSLNSFFIQVGVDNSGGTNFNTTGTSKLVSVPYSLYSRRAMVADSISPQAIQSLPQLTLSGDTLKLGGISQVVIPFYLFQLTESQVDSMVANNGFLLTEVDGSITNEIQNLSLTGNNLSITGNTAATVIDLSPYLDNTNLTEAQVDVMVSNNGFLLTEVDGSITNEIQNLSQVLTEGNNANSQSIVNLGGVTVGTTTGATSAIVDVSSTSKGFLPPRMTQVQRDAIANPTEGLIVWCTDCGLNGLLSAFDGLGWITISLTTSNGTIPQLTTLPISTYGFSSATFGGNILNDGGAPILARGICYSTTPNPNISNSISQITSGVGTFTEFVTNLDTNKTYYVRAFATNANGTAYGNQVIFTTKSVLSLGQLYQGGIIYYLLQPGDKEYVMGEQHGLIALPWDYYNNTLTWAGSTCGISGVVTTNFVGDGAINSNNAYNACSTVVPQGAIQIAYNLIVNGYSDWHVPSSGELLKMMQSSAFTQLNLTNNRYWSSTKTSSSSISTWLRNGNNISDYNMAHNGPSANVYLRVIRYF